MLNYREGAHMLAGREIAGFVELRGAVRRSRFGWCASVRPGEHAFGLAALPLILPFIPFEAEPETNRRPIARKPRARKAKT